MARPLVILDRDGVINYDSRDYIKSVDEWRPIPGSLEAIARLNAAGWRVAVASNQAGIAHGYYSEADLKHIHTHMAAELAKAGGRIDLIVHCPHSPDAHCDCRKPAPGMLVEIGRRLGVDLAGVPFVGDKASDVAAARAVGARPLLVRTGLAERTAAALAITPAVEVFPDLAAAADFLLGAN